VVRLPLVLDHGFRPIEAHRGLNTEISDVLERDDFY
jgi:hypothetical protein